MLSYKIKKIIKALFPFIGLIIVFVLFHFTNWFLLKYYPVVMNFILFLTFFISLFKKETIIQKIAKATKEDITPIEITYTRNLTYVWAIFCFINFIISFLTIFMSENIWYIYNGIVSYILVGLLFGIEYIVRLRFFKANGI